MNEMARYVADSYSFVHTEQFNGIPLREIKEQFNIIHSISETIWIDISSSIMVAEDEGYGNFSVSIYIKADPCQPLEGDELEDILRQLNINQKLSNSVYEDITGGIFVMRKAA
jgi:hypothetical protein